MRHIERILAEVPGRTGWHRVARGGRVRYRHATGVEVVQGPGGWLVELAGERPFDPHRRAKDALDQADVLLAQAQVRATA